MSSAPAKLTVDILARAKRRREPIVVYVDVDGERQPFEVYVREMTAADRADFESAMSPGLVADEMNVSNDSMKLVRQLLVIATAEDVDGNRLFSLDDIDFIGSLPISVIEPIVNMAQSLNAFGNRDVQELAKNFEPTNDAASH